LSASAIRDLIDKIEKLIEIEIGCREVLKENRELLKRLLQKIK